MTSSLGDGDPLDNGNTSMTDTYCIVCMDNIQDKKTLKCSHSFCSSCIDDVFRVKPACPVCNAFYGTYYGTQPRDGVMKVTRTWQCLPGYEGCGTIAINYSFPPGIQGPEHPNPGKRYASTSRQAFLPACEEGEQVLQLLKTAFKRRLIFTVGTSATTGLSNSITWNDIHHKTNIGGGPAIFGYPDPSYLKRVKEELYLKGVTEASLEHSPMESPV
ncbi:probable E3 ubiquitin-protein ligase DTX3 [Alosa sapidissima]|uniref:probable E3 ubiquitin-protein ligase DTX3 n=1 Tax=Alosa sapidissima TaxID=34773 RepID=UPI001C08BD50|nr:probable E3 ubiquitin-protein ligase DTX3 [Alosa sapidissima]